MMENVIEVPLEPTTLQTIIFCVLLVSISIFLLRTLGRSIQKSTPLKKLASTDLLPWKLSSVFMLFGFFLLGQVAVVSFALTSSPEGGEATAIELDSPLAFIGLSLVNLLVSAIAFLVYRSWQTRHPETASFWLGSKGGVRTALKLGFLALLCWVPGHLGLAGLWSLCLEGLDVQLNAQESVMMMSQALEQSNWALIIPLCFYGIVMAPIAEEILFRGVLFRWLHGHMGFIVALGVSSIAFALVHDSVASWLPIAALGGVCSWLYHRSGQLLASITLHATFNTSTFLLITIFQEKI